MRAQPNVFQFQQSVMATTTKPIAVGQYTLPARHDLRLRGYRSDGKLFVESAFPGSNKLWEFPIDAGAIDDLMTDRGLLKEQLTALSAILGEETPTREDVESLAKSLDN